MEIVKLSPSAYQLHDTTSCVNVGLVVTSDGAVLIDTGSSADMARKIQSRIREVTEQPVVYVISSHWHPEHTRGNGSFDVPVIAHQACRARMEQHKQACGGESTHGQSDAGTGGGCEGTARSTISFDHDGYLYVGGTLLELIHVPGHTEGSIAVHLPSEGVLFASDTVFVGTPPVLDHSDPVRWLESLARLEKLHASLIVPGQGRVACPDDLSHLLLYLRSQVASLESEAMREATTRGDESRESGRGDRTLPPGMVRLNRAARGGGRNVGDEGDRLARLAAGGDSSALVEDSLTGAKRIASR